MKTPHSTLYRFSAEAIATANKLPVGTVSEAAHKNGMSAGEPLTVAMDCLLKYAEAYRERFERPLAEDGVLGDYWKDAIKNLRGLLNGDGVNGMKSGHNNDSKDNGCLESMFWAALHLAGFKEKDL